MSRRTIHSTFAVLLMIFAAHLSPAQAVLFQRSRPSQAAVRHPAEPADRRESHTHIPAWGEPHRQAPSRSWSTLPQRLSDYGKWPPYYR